MAKLFQFLAANIKPALTWFFGREITTAEEKNKMKDQVIQKPVISGPSFRVLSMPKARLEFPKHFMPKTMHLGRDTKEKLVQKIDAALQKNGLSLGSVGRMTIAYPHKDPALFFRRHSGGYDAAVDFIAMVKAAAPQVEWLMADAICETVHLNRTLRGSSSFYSITQSHQYAVRPELQKKPLPFLSNDNKNQEVFIIVDDVMEQGTTIANLCSYLTHNGALVLGAAVDGEIDVLQRRHAWEEDITLRAEFRDASRNTGQLPHLAQAFAASALKYGHQDATPDKCLEVFEEALQEHGKSLFSLTHAECSRLINTVSTEREETSFPDLLQQLYLEARYKKYRPGAI